MTWPWRSSNRTCIVRPSEPTRQVVTCRISSPLRFDSTIVRSSICRTDTPVNKGNPRFDGLEVTVLDDRTVRLEIPRSDASGGIP